MYIKTKDDEEKLRSERQRGGAECAWIPAGPTGSAAVRWMTPVCSPSCVFTRIEDEHLSGEGGWKLCVC